MSSNSETRSVEIIIKGSQADATIKQIKESAIILNAQMNKLSVNSQEFADKAKQLAGVNARLADIREEAKLAAKSFNDMGAGANSPNLAKGRQLLTDMKKELKGLKGELAGLDEGSDAYLKAAAKAGELKDKIGDINDDIKVQSGDNAFQRIGTSLGLVKDKLLGLDFKGVAVQFRAIGEQVKGMSFKEMTAGIGGVAAALKDLAVSMLSNPFILLAAAIAAVAYVAYDVVTAFASVDDETQTVTDSIKEASKAFDDFGDRVTTAYISISEAMGRYSKSQAELLKKDIANNKEKRDLVEKHNEDVKKLAKELEVDIKDMEDGRMSETYKGNFDDLENRKHFNKEKLKLEEQLNAEMKALTVTQRIEKIDIAIKGYNDEIKASKAASEKYQAEIKKDEDARVALKKKADDTILADRKKLLDDLAALEYEYSLKGLTEEDKKIYAVHKKYADLKKRAGTNADDLMRIQKDYNKELNDATGTMDAHLLEQHQELAGGINIIEVKSVNDTINVHKLEFKERMLMAAEFFQKYEFMISVFTSRATRVMDLYDKKQQIRDSQQLKQNDSNLDSKLSKNDAYLRAGLVSQKKHDATAISLQKEHDKKKADIEHKAAERSKKLAIAKAVIDGISTVVKDLASYPYPFNLIVAALDSAIIGGEIALMASTPAYAKGGLHDPNGFTNGAATYNSSSGVPFIAGEAGREWIAPNWMLASPKTAPIIENLENIRQSRSFAGGGSSQTTTASPVFKPSNSTNGNDAVLIQLSNEVSKLSAILNGGVNAYLDYDGYKRTLSKIDGAKNAAKVG